MALTVHLARGHERPPRVTAGRRPDRNQEDHHEHHGHTLTRVRICAACDVAVWIHRGRVRGRGDIDELLDAYRLL